MGSERSGRRLRRDEEAVLRTSDVRSAQLARRLRLSGLPRTHREVSHALRLLGQLRLFGWQRSIAARTPIDRDGRPVPWMNYAATSILEGLLTPGSRVFEYGSGQSSLWLLQRAGEVHVVEHDHAWAEKVRAMPGADRLNLQWVPCTGDAVEAPPGDRYVAAAASASSGDGFDVVIVDGVARCACLRFARQCLRRGGVLVLDDAEREGYAAVRRELTQDGDFRELVVTGVKPTYSFLSATSFFIPCG